MFVINDVSKSVIEKMLKCYKKTWTSMQNEFWIGDLQTTLDVLPIFIQLPIEEIEIPLCTKRELRTIIHHIKNLPPWHSHVIDPTLITISNVEDEPNDVTINSLQPIGVLNLI